MIGKTGLALLAFLGAGELPGEDGEFRAEVEAAIAFLKGVQDDRTGHFGDSSAYSHAIVTSVMSGAMVAKRKAAERTISARA